MSRTCPSHPSRPALIIAAFVITAGWLSNLESRTFAQEAFIRSDWPQWRGPSRDNVSLETGLLQQWPEHGPKLVWRADGLGRGIASVSVADGRVYSIGHHFPGAERVDPPANQRRGGRRFTPDGEYVIAMDASGGQLLWAARVGESVPEAPSMRWLSQRTPTVDKDRLYVISAEGDLICLRAGDGFELWRKNYSTDFGGAASMWGYCDYPLVDGEHLICTPGGSEATMVALNKRTGELVWKCSVPDAKRHVYAATLATEAGGKRQYVTFLASGLIGVSAADGTFLWRYERFAHQLNALTPILLGDKILCANGFRGNGISQLGFQSSDGSLEVVEEVFAALPSNAVSAFQDNVLLVGDRIYSSGRGAGLAAIDANSLQVIWTERQLAESQNAARPGSVGFLYADQRLYVRYDSGRMVLAEPQPDGYAERGSFLIPDTKRANGVTMPVVSGGHLFLRDDDRMFCYDVRSESAVEQVATKVVSLDLSGHIEPNIRAQGSERSLRSVFVPTPHDIVDRMLDLAEIKQDDVVCDLGSGDGRIVIAAARRFGCRAIGYEISEELIETSRAAAEAAGVGELATFKQQDIFDVELSGANVVTLYLLTEQNQRLLGQLEKLAPGSRIVAHQNTIPGVRPDRVLRTESLEDPHLHTLYVWTTPLTKTSEKDD